MYFLEDLIRTYLLFFVNGTKYQWLMNIICPILLYAISSNWHVIIKTLNDFLKFDFSLHNVIELNGTITEDKFDIASRLSPKLRALIFYINRNCMCDPQLHKLIEISLSSCFLFHETTPKFDTEYLVHQNIPLKLTDTISCRINLRNEHLHQEKKTLNVKQITVKVYSKTENIESIKNFLKCLQDEYDEFVEMKMHNSSYCFMYMKDDESDVPTFTTNVFSSTKTFDNLVFDDKNKLKDRLDFFLNNKEFYNKLGIPYTLGLLLYGSPGCGKTSTVKAIANYTNRHLIIIPMNKIKKLSTLRQIILNEKIEDFKVPHSKRLYIFEEIDCNGMEKIISKRSIESDENGEKQIKELNELLTQVAKHDSQYSLLHGPQNKHESYDDKITLGSLLELIDGINEASGRILIMTTNKDPSSFDDALLRPGRIDIQMKFSKCSRNEINQIYKLWFSNDIPIEYYNNILEHKYSPAELGELFINNISNPQEILKVLCQKF